MAFRAHQVELELLHGLRAFAGEGFNGFGRPHADRAEARAIAKAEAAEQQAIQQEFRRNQVSRDLPSLLAALTVLAEETST